MQAFLANLTAAVLFIHAVFGCGWHHAHGENHTSAVLATEACCDHHHHDGDRIPHEPPGPCCMHCETSCVYTLPQKVELDSQFAISWIDLVATLPTVTGSQIFATSGWLSVEAHEPVPAPPLRLHLLHQLLTI